MYVCNLVQNLPKTGTQCRPNNLSSRSFRNLQATNTNLYHAPALPSCNSSFLYTHTNTRQCGHYITITSVLMLACLCLCGVVSARRWYVAKRFFFCTFCTFCFQLCFCSLRFQPFFCVQILLLLLFSLWHCQFTSLHSIRLNVARLCYQHRCHHHHLYHPSLFILPLCHFATLHIKTHTPLSHTGSSTASPFACCSLTIYCICHKIGIYSVCGFLPNTKLRNRRTRTRGDSVKQTATLTER